jgi:2-polyprenyl-3-methyl-5-hydroxy-6-metoxy-1,4-benzoquinol methylase
MTLNLDSFYTNQGNPSILQFIDADDRTILDIGCGAGDLGKLIRSRSPSTQVTGVTCSQKEYEQATQVLNHCLCLNIEQDQLPLAFAQEFDVLLFCHVLEHLVDPIAVIQKLLPQLKAGGKIIIALPNIANWRDRYKLALGKFEYTDGGVMDRTHLHFYTFHTASRSLVEPIPQIELEEIQVKGSVPLAFLRHHFLNQRIRERIDRWGCSWMPNLFGSEIILKAVKR